MSRARWKARRSRVWFVDEVRRSTSDREAVVTGVVELRKGVCWPATRIADTASHNPMHLMTNDNSGETLKRNNNTKSQILRSSYGASSRLSVTRDGCDLKTGTASELTRDDFCHLSNCSEEQSS